MDNGRSGELVAMICEVLQGADLVADDLGDDRIMTMLTGEWKRTIPVLFSVGDRSVTVTSAFTGILDEGHAEVYAMLLHRNERLRHVHFALDDVGQLVLIGRLPLAAVDHTLLGEVLGEVLDTADSAFNGVLRAGFAGYLAHEQRWRKGAGLPPNPIEQEKD